MRNNYADMVFCCFDVDLLDPNLPFTLVIKGPDDTLEFPIDVSMLCPGTSR